MKYYIEVLKKYATFTGRSRRSEYWYFVLFNFLFSLAAGLMDNVIGTDFTFETAYGPQSLFYGSIYIVYALAVFIPSLAVLVRRLHDVGKSGWFILISFIPFIGAIWLLVLLFTDSQVGPNKWGPNPKGIGNPDDVDNIGNHLVQ
ncbi:DUF805 domain-containing protein [Foetidibacter luteolus]|uniref:DUF805 domain-containing protein n=1 Tax=Foetidibacter luteolus TaxID=2608880 RepID=UPI00129B559C|nr:DUF805 domain-containing protein [Foetidibacter luteolus]